MSGRVGEWENGRMGEEENPIPFSFFSRFSLPRFLLLSLSIFTFSHSPTLPFSHSFFTAWAESIAGFSQKTVNWQLDFEKRYQAMVSADECRKNLLILTEEPHVAGTLKGKMVAEFIKKRFESYGLETKVYEYQVLIPFPQETVVELIEPNNLKYRALGKEEGWVWDKDSFESDIIAGYNAYSPEAELTAQLVYANYGLPEDYKKLEEFGISVKGKIVIVKYGSSYRGVKVREAELRGAAGVIIYSDPKDSGYVKGDPYPRGPWRHESSIERGTVKYIFEYPGDPLTPGWPSLPAANRLKREEAKDLPKIPAVPLSYGDAKPFLEALSGPIAPPSWQGGLPMAYHIGPGPAKVYLKLTMDFQIRSIYNIIAKLEGIDQPEKLIILGNHHDAWVYGACDPSSGTAALLEVARCLSELSKLGYKPKRSILLAAWDGEEFGMLGSTEWVEQFKEELQKEAVAYLNVDTAVTGSDFDASSIPSLKPLIREVTKEVIDPKSGKSVYELWKQKQTKGEGRKAENRIVGAQHAAPNKEKEERMEEHVKLGNLGSGSDFAPFLSHIALPSLSFSFDGPYGVYHSLHDDFYWVEHFADPNFEYHAATAKIWGLLALRLANADLLPFDYYEYADEVSEYIGDFKSGKSGKSAHERKFEPGSDELTAELGALSFEVERFKTATRKLNEATRLILNRHSDNRDSNKDTRLVLKKLNDILPQLEQKFLSAVGLPNRPWMKHLIYAPSLDSGYGSELLPGLNGALIEGNIQLAKSQIETLKNAIINLRSAIEQMNDELGGSK